jgi:acylpyruvate hydrolase
LLRWVGIITELGNTAPKEPFFFIKPTTSYLANNGTVELPRGIDVHHEVELGVIIGKKARDVSEKDAMKYIAGYTLAIDM